MPVAIPVPLRANANTRLEAKYNVITEFPSFDLHSAAATGNMGLVEYALARGQPINSVLDGVLPLHAACAGGNEQVVKLLIDHGADVNAPRLPRRYSNEKNRDASAPIVGTSGSTPLHFAAANGNTNIVTTLLLKGAHADRADKHGITPEQLAIQNGWLECANVLRKWVENKDRDLREREVLLPDDSTHHGRRRQGSLGVGPEPDPARKRLKVKRSVDTALNMLKASSSALSDAYIKPNSSNNNLSSTPPASPTAHSGEYAPDGDRASPSLQPGGRRPSLPYLPPLGSPRLQKTLTKPPASPRRPRSAGTGAEQDAETSSPKGSTKKLGTKYSLMNIFKKNESNSLERMPSHTPSMASLSGLPSASSNTLPSPPTAQPIPLSSSPPTSDSLGPPISGSAFSSSGLRHRMGSDAAQTSPPSAVDLHNAMAQQQQSRRDRSGSSSSRFESIGLGLSFDGNGSVDLSSSPASRSAIVARTPSLRGHHRHRSGSTQRNGTVFDDDVVIVAEERSGSSQSSLVRPSILRTHNRSSSSGQGHGLPSSLRALRFDSSSSGADASTRARDSPPLRGSNSTNSLVRFADKRERSRSGSPATPSLASKAKANLPESAPPTVTDFQPKPKEENVADDDDEEDDEYYGRTYEHGTKGLATHSGRHRGPSVSSIASDSSLSPSNFPFSIHNPPPIPAEEAPARASQEGRDRGDSVSSSSTNLTTETSASAGSVTATPPQLSPRSSFLDLSADSGPRVYVDEVNDGDASTALPEMDYPSRKPRVPLDINIDIIPSHAQAEAEALVQRAQQDILQMAQDGEEAPSKTPLSARLAAYGESLAKLRELQQQADETAEQGDVKTPVAREPLSPNRVCNRQRSMEERPAAKPSKTKQPRRPHTSSGTSSCESIVAASNHSLDSPRPNHHQPSHSTSAMELFGNVLPAGSLYKRAQPTKIPQDQLSRVSSLEGHETDTELGPSLFRVSTAPNSTANAKGKREQARLASSTKLTRMGFSRTPANDMVARSPPSSKRFGGLKTLMQTFKGKQSYD